MNGTRLIGVVLGVIGLGVALIAGLWLALQVSSGDLTSGGAVVGAFLTFIPVGLLVGFGIYLFNRGDIESKEESEMLKQRQLLDIVKSRGRVTIPDLALEMQVNAVKLKDMVHQLVGLGVFSGYINWDEGTLYSAEVASLKTLSQCNNCGGEISLVGRGIVRCRFCGTEYFLN